MFYAKFKKMKRIFVFVPAILLVLFLFNSFVLKEKDAAKVISNKSGLVNTVFTSTDGGQTWQDISKGKIRICQVFYRQDPGQTQSIFVAPT